MNECVTHVTIEMIQNSVHARRCWYPSNAQTEGECIGQALTLVQVHWIWITSQATKLMHVLTYFIFDRKTKSLSHVHEKSINEMTLNSTKNHACDHAPKGPHAVCAQYAECSGHFQYTKHIYWRVNQKTINFVGVYEYDIIRPTCNL